jgi:general L-amino acid transport system permease protein
MTLARTRSVLAQTLLLLMIAALGAWLITNLQQNLAARNIAAGYGFINDTAGFAIGEAEIRYSASDTVARALAVGLINTLKVSALAILGATLLGVALGLARVSDHALLRGFSRLYIEVVRNIPLLVQLLFLYAFALNVLPPVHQALEPIPGFFLSNRGLAMPALVLSDFTIQWPQRGRFNIEGGMQLSAELMTLVVGLSIYTAAYIAEIVRGGIESVPMGQSEAAKALGMRSGQTMRRIVFPQALRAILPPLTSWYLNTVKNSSLAIAVGYPDLLSVVDTIINQTGQAIEGVLIVIAVYLSVNLLLSWLINRYNAVIARRGFAPGTGGARRQSPASWRALIGSKRRTVVSLALLLGAAYAVWSVLDWLVFSATSSGNAQDCRETSGACWPFIRENYRTILFGTYPLEEQWRAALSLLLFGSALVASFWKRTWGRELAAIWIVVPIASICLMHGGPLGLTVVPTEKWSGLPLTLLLASLAVILAFPLAVLLALGRRSKQVITQSMSIGFIELMRGVPLVGVLFMAAVLFPLFAPPSFEIDSYMRVQLALILFTAAYMAEAVRGGLQAVPNGQVEAAAALGLNQHQTTTRIVLPQALRVSIPGLVNTSISEVKNTTLVLIVGMFDVLQTTRLSLVEVEWRPFFAEAYAFTATLFFGLCFAISQLSRRVETHLNVAHER